MLLVFTTWKGRGGTRELQLTSVKFSIGAKVVVVVVVVYGRWTSTFEQKREKNTKSHSSVSNHIEFALANDYFVNVIEEKQEENQEWIDNIE